MKSSPPLLLLLALLLPAPALAQGADEETDSNLEGDDDDSAGEESTSAPTWPIPRRGVSVPLPEGTLEPGGKRVEVVVSIVISPEGEVEDALVAESCGNEVIDRAAEDAAWLLDFFPSMLDGEPIRVTIDYPMVFVPPPPLEPEVVPAGLTGRVEVKGSLEPVSFLDVSLFPARTKAEVEAEQAALEAEQAAAEEPEAPVEGEGEVEGEVEIEGEGEGDGKPGDPQVLEVVEEPVEQEEPPELPKVKDLLAAEEALLVATTDEDGRFAFDEVPPGLYIVAVGSGGFRLEKYVEFLGEGVEREVVYRIRPTGVPETVVVASRRETDTPERVLTAEQLRKMPGAGNDPMAAMQSLPGVIHTAPSFGAGDQAQAPVLRGASAEDSVLYLDGLPVPIIFHTLSAFSITGDYLIDKAFLKPAASEARYGDLTGGVVGLDLRSPRKDRVGGYIDPGLGQASFALEGPIREKSRFYVGLRRSYYDLLINLVMPKDSPVEFATAPYFQDQQVILEADVAPWITLGVGYIGTLDGLKMLGGVDDDPDAEEEEEEEPWEIRMLTDMHRIYLRGDMRGPNGLTNRLTPALTFWGTEFEFTDAFQFRDRHTVFHLVDDLHAPLLKWLTLDAGVILEVDRLTQWRDTPAFTREDAGPSAGLGNDNLTGRQVDTRVWLGGYISAPIKPHERLTIAPEFRLDWFQAIGEVVPQVRGRIGYSPIDEVRLSLAGGRYAQSPSYEELNAISGNPELGHEGAWHVNLGVQVAPGPWLDIDLQGYAKFLDNQTVTENEAGTSFMGFADLGGFATDDEEDPTHGLSNSGIGRIWGMELFARFGVLRTVGITGWLGYSLSWAQRRDFEGEEWRWFQHDRRHAITALLQVALPGEFSIGARFQFQSGAPKTPIEDSIYYADWGSFIPVYGDLYSARGVPYHQLDIRIDKKFRKEKHTVEIYLDIQNVYAARSADFDIPSYDYREEFGFQMIPAINFAVRVEF
jgi:TonB family protein